MITLHINERVCIRLSAYADKNSISALSDAIQDLLDKISESHLHGKPGPLSPMVKLKDIISYSPEGEENFKRALLKNKRAFIRIHYGDGRPPVVKEWNAANISRESTVHGNLASGHLRDWRDKNICRAEVSIDPQSVDGPRDYLAEGEYLREQAKSLVVDYMKGQSKCRPHGPGLSQAQIFKGCGLGWNNYAAAKSSSQIAWLNALLWNLSEEGKVERPGGKNWRLAMPKK